MESEGSEEHCREFLLFSAQHLSLFEWSPKACATPGTGMSEFRPFHHSTPSCRVQDRSKCGHTSK